MLAWLAALPCAFARPPADAADVAARALENAIIIDTHADTPQAFLGSNYDLADPASTLMLSIPKMRAGHLGAEFFSIWVDVTWPQQDLIHRAFDLIDATDQQVATHSTFSAWQALPMTLSACTARAKSPCSWESRAATRFKATCACWTSTIAWAFVTLR